MTILLCLFECYSRLSILADKFCLRNNTQDSKFHIVRMNREASRQLVLMPTAFVAAIGFCLHGGMPEFG
jgi:hypothetical protein